MKKFMLPFITALLLTLPPLSAHQEKQKDQESLRRITLSDDHQKNLNRRINAFVQEHVVSLQEQELQILANLIYFSYALASLDSHVRTKAQEILMCAKTTHNALISYTKNTETKEYLSKILNTLDGALQAQDEHLKAWQHCCAFIDSLDRTSPLSKAVDAFKEMVEIELGTWAQDHTQEFNKHLEESAHAFIEYGESLTTLGHTYQNLQQNKMPLPSIPENKHMTKIVLASRTSSKVDELCWKSIATALQLTETENILQDLSIAVMGFYYRTIMIQLNKGDAHHRTFIYNAQGLIPLEQRTQELPTM